MAEREIHTQEQANQDWNEGDPEHPEERAQGPEGTPAPTIGGPPDLESSGDGGTGHDAEAGGQDAEGGATGGQEDKVADQTPFGGTERTGDMSEDPGSNTGGGQFGG